MYYPRQVSLALGNKFSHSIKYPAAEQRGILFSRGIGSGIKPDPRIKYSEKIIPQYNEFLICLWDIQPVSNSKNNSSFTIVTDGCIDLVADFQHKNIWFVGMSKTNFNHKINMPSCLIGARFKPGAFHAITQIPANKAMDKYIPLNTFDKDFPIDLFFKFPFSEAKLFFSDYIGKLINGKNTNKFIALFDDLNKNIPSSVSEIYQKLNYSHRQCQRLFIKNYGLSPQMVLCILRFQKCLEFIISGKKKPKEALEISNYYDQSHFIKDFKRHIGLTPQELFELYSS